MSLVKRGSPKKMVAIDPVTKYRRPILSNASTTKWSSSDCSMGEPPCHFLLKAPLVPIRVLDGEVAGDHGPGGTEEVARDLQALGSGHGTEDLRHVVVHHLDIPRVDDHSRIIPRARKDRYLHRSRGGRNDGASRRHLSRTSLGQILCARVSRPFRPHLRIVSQTQAVGLGLGITAPWGGVPP